VIRLHLHWVFDKGPRNSRSVGGLEHAYHEGMRYLILSLALALPLLSLDLTKLTIQVKTKAGKPVDHASVIVKFVQGRSVVKFGKKIRTAWEQQTNEEGIAKIPSLPQGTILVQVIAKNYQTFGQNFEVNEEQKTLEITLNPPQEQYSAH